MRKILPFFILLSLPLLFTSCITSYSALIAFDDIAAMKSTVLLVPLSADEARVERLERYGQDRRADRAQRRMDRENALIREAFDAHFTFCEVRYYYPGELEFIEAQVLQEGFASPFLLEYRQVWVEEGDDDMDEEWALGILRNDGSFLAAPFPDEANIGDVFTRGNLNHAVRELDRELRWFHNRRNNYMARKGLN